MTLTVGLLVLLVALGASAVVSLAKGTRMAGGSLLWAGVILAAGVLMSFGSLVVTGVLMAMALSSVLFTHAIFRGKSRGAAA